MKINEQIKELIRSSDLDCIKLGLVYLKQDLDKCDFSDKQANFFRNFYYHSIKKLNKYEKSLSWDKQHRISDLIDHIHNIIETI